MKIRKNICYKDHVDFDGYKFGYSFPKVVSDGRILLKVGGCCNTNPKNIDKLNILKKHAQNFEYKKKADLIYFTYDCENFDKSYIDMHIKMSKKLDKIKKLCFEYNASIHLREVYYAFKKIYFSIDVVQKGKTEEIFTKLNDIGIAYTVYDHLVLILKGENDENNT